MIHPKTFLLQKIIASDKNYLKSFGQLDAKHFEDIAEVMKDFAEQTVVDALEKLNAGYEIKINGTFYSTKVKEKTVMA